VSNKIDRHFRRSAKARSGAPTTKLRRTKENPMGRIIALVCASRATTQAHQNSAAGRQQAAPGDDRQSLFVCPLTGRRCEGDLAYLCEDYGCARKAGLSPHSAENL
jgi:hypothetical protein